MHGITRGLLATDCEVAAARWVQRKLGDCRHERRVLAIAAKLFDLTRPHLGLGLAEHRLLRLSSLIHDVGRCVNEKDHPEEGAWMITQTSAFDMSPHDRRALAFLTRYHRGNVPREHDEDHLGPHDHRRPLRSVLALLRAADALDSRRLAPPQLVLAMDGHKLSVQCLVHSDDIREARRAFDKRKKFGLLSDLLGAEVQVDIARAAVSLSA